jgi:hypothetical protein
MKELYITTTEQDTPRFNLNKVTLNRNQHSFMETYTVEDARQIKPLGLYTIHPLGLTITIDGGHMGDNTIRVSVEDPSISVTSW